MTPVPFRAGHVLIAFRWVREGLFRFTFELHRSSIFIGAADPCHSTHCSLKKKDLFNAKEAHNHTFSHAVCNSTQTPVSLIIYPQTTNWGW